MATVGGQTIWGQYRSSFFSKRNAKHIDTLTLTVPVLVRILCSRPCNRPAGQTCSVAAEWSLGSYDSFSDWGSALLPLPTSAWVTAREQEDLCVCDYWVTTEGSRSREAISPLVSTTQMVKNLPAAQETRVWSLGQEDPLEKEMATRSSILAWRLSWTEEPGGLQSTGSQRVRHNWATNTLSTVCGYCAGTWRTHAPSPNALNSSMRWVFWSPFCDETKVLCCQRSSRKQMVHLGAFKEWALHRGVNRIEGIQVPMEPGGVSNSWKSLAPLGLKGRRRERLTQTGDSWSQGRVKTLSYDKAGRWGWGYWIYCSLFSHCFHPLGSHHCFPLETSRWGQEHLDDATCRSQLSEGQRG